MTETKAIAHPLQSDKKLIQSAYLDILYFEYREHSHYWKSQCGVASGAITLVCAYISPLPVWALFCLLGASAWGFFHQQRAVGLFRRLRDNLVNDLRQHGIGISEYGRQLDEDAMVNSDWGKLGNRATSGLGIVSPMTSTKEHVRSDLRLDIFSDATYGK